MNTSRLHLIDGVQPARANKKAKHIRFYADHYYDYANGAAAEPDRRTAHDAMSI